MCDIVCPTTNTTKKGHCAITKLSQQGSESSSDCVSSEESNSVRSSISINSTNSHKYFKVKSGGGGGGGGDSKERRMTLPNISCDTITGANEDANSDERGQLVENDNEQLLVEIVTLNRALIAAREGNLKLLQASDLFFF